MTPGETLTITVGNSRMQLGANSSISRGNTVLLLAQGGYTGSSNNAGGIGGLGGQATNCIGQVCFSIGSFSKQNDIVIMCNCIQSILF